MQYKVYKFESFSPAELSSWLNEICNEDNLMLISADGGYYIFAVNPPNNPNLRELESGADIESQKQSN